MTVRRASGFTLIELLVTVALIGIVLSIAILGLGVVTGDDEIETESSRFVALMEVAKDESMLQGREFGLELLQQGYRFVELDPLTRQWVEILGDDLLRLRALPENLELELYIEGQIIELDAEALALINEEDDDDNSNLDPFQPHVFIFSSGELTPFELHFRELYNDNRVMLQADLFGNLSILEEELP
ncbi:MAG: type II secretion system minor pseudopilin GspH [Pseudomonadota bacterium]